MIDIMKKMMINTDMTTIEEDKQEIILSKREEETMEDSSTILRSIIDSNTSFFTLNLSNNIYLRNFISRKAL